MTGSPAVGKTTVLLKTTDMLKVKGFTGGGMPSREVCSSRMRVGFEVMDMCLGKTGCHAHTNQKHGLQAGKCDVNFADLDDVGTQAVRKANKECDIAAVDEAGPMELFSEKFRNAVKNAADGPKPVATIRWRIAAQLVKKIKAKQDAGIVVLAWENRDNLPPAIASKTVEYLAATRLE
jgi:nucleoside-triphosphatase THEP1